MVIGVISDTHRYVWVIENAIKKLENVDVLIHLGDNVQDVTEIKKYYKGEIINVKGNCDFSVDVPGEKMQVIGGKKVFITHGHRYDVKYDLSRIRYKAMEMEADIVLFGHTHVSKIAYEDGIWFVNPGSPGVPRDGFNSVATIEIKNGKINPSIKGV
ncbi:metallophosphoesterase [Clostridium sp. P21]|uniref:Phosphoesterase n=1 Tax=Clostridium muellerianum TaxID=2716538 RepID=A0A7Y0EHK1_9CLOT|nr:metallophosphoesterase [Clostridium muellerianum]